MSFYQFSQETEYVKKQWCKRVFTETETSYVSCSLTEKWKCGKGTTDDSQDIPQYTCVEMLLWINGQCLGFTLSHVYHVVKELTVESRRAKEQTSCGECCLIYFNFKLYFCKSVPESQMFTRCNSNQCSSSHFSKQSSGGISYTFINVFTWTSNWEVSELSVCLLAALVQFPSSKWLWFCCRRKLLCIILKTNLKTSVHSATGSLVDWLTAGGCLLWPYFYSPVAGVPVMRIKCATWVA